MGHVAAPCNDENCDSPDGLYPPDAARGSVLSQELLMRNNYVLIDWENVQPESMELLDCEHVQVRVFVGAMQKDIATEKAAALQPLGKPVEYIRVAR